jgi:hypothetical protein
MKETLRRLRAALLRLPLVAIFFELPRLRAQLAELRIAWREFRDAHELLQTIPESAATMIERENRRRFEAFVNQAAKRIEELLR